MTNKYIDFEVLKERWGKYSLDDGSTLKIRFIVTSIMSIQENGKTKYNASIQNIQTIYPAEHLIGTPQTAVFSNDIITKNIEKDDVGFDVLDNPANEYILDNGTKLKIFPQVIKATRSSLRNKKGEPIYMISTNMTLNFTDPKLN